VNKCSLAIQHRISIASTEPRALNGALRLAESFPHIELYLAVVPFLDLYDSAIFAEVLLGVRIQEKTVA
jgi:hypothetical protein